MVTSCKTYSITSQPWYWHTYNPWTLFIFSQLSLTCVCMYVCMFGLKQFYHMCSVVYSSLQWRHRTVPSPLGFIILFLIITHLSCAPFLSLNGNHLYCNPIILSPHKLYNNGILQHKPLTLAFSIQPNTHEIHSSCCVSP